ncbi:MAG: PHP domain-containing protein [Spirochaetaceae bacterium]|nr:MAG: PHP domain-containing protein [Spirochaetaceae bacterium]
MTALLADLHIHTALSPCASRQMLPGNIVRACRQRGLNMIAICDHNSAANVAAVTEAAKRETGPALKVIPGIEVTTREEVHVLGLLPTLEAAVSVSTAVLASLPNGKSTSWGYSTQQLSNPVGSHPGCRQWIVDAEDRQTGAEPRVLAGASSYSLEEAVFQIRLHGGIAVAAHIDRRAFSVLGQLGFFPGTPQFSAAEISAAGAARGRREERWLEAFRQHGLPLISGSDSHCLEEIGCSCTAFLVSEPCFAELVLAIRGIGARRCAIA